MMSARKTPRRRPEAGVAIISVLLFVGVIGLMSATYLRQVILDWGNSPVSRPILDATESAHTGMQWGRQVVRSGWGTTSTTVGSGSSAASVQVSSLADDRYAVVASAVDSDGLGATLRVEVDGLAEPLADHPDTLPRLSTDALARLMSDPTVPKTWISGTQTLSGVDLYGLVIVETYATLMLDDVTLEGAIISQDAYGNVPLGDFEPISAPAVVLSGPVRVEPASFLPGVTVVMPDGVLRDWSSPVQAQFGGDVVAHSVLLGSTGGSILGNLASVVDPTLGTHLVRPRATRTPREWSDDLDMNGTTTVRWQAFVPRVTGTSDVAAITGYTFD
jgi:hypothetical protein